MCSCGKIFTVALAERINGNYWTIAISGEAIVGKLVVLKLAEGDFERGFYAILQIGDKSAPPAVEITGKLPPNPNILRDYYHLSINSLF